MLWFKNLMIYRLTKNLDWSEEALQENLEKESFTPCSQGEMTHFGWTNPLKDSELFYFQSGKNILLKAQKEDKILPAAVIKQELDARIAELEKKEGRKLRKLEKQSLKEDVIATLLPRAFSKNQTTTLWVDTENQLIYVNSASSKRAEDALALLRKSLGSLPVVPLTFANDMSEVMRHWIINNDAPQWAAILEDAEIKGGSDEAVIRCKKQDLGADEIIAFLQSGKTISKLALDWDEHVSFVLKDDATMARLKFADELRDKNADIDKEDIAQRLDADFILMTGTLSQLTDHLLNAFGGEKERL